MQNNNQHNIDLWVNTNTPSAKPPLYPPIYSSYTAHRCIKAIQKRYENKRLTWSASVRRAVEEQLEYLKSFDSDALLIEGLTTSYVRRIEELYQL